MSATPAESATTGFRERLLRFFRFNLRSALLLVAILCGVLAWASRRDFHVAYRRGCLVAALERLGGRVRFDETQASQRLAVVGWFGPRYERLAWPVVQIDLDGTKATDADIKQLMGYLRSEPSLQWIGLRGTSVGDDAIDQLSLLTQLQVLHLTGTQVTDGSAESLARLRNLVVLDLESTHVSDSTAATVLGLSDLTTLNLAHTSVSDRGIMVEEIPLQLQEIKLQGSKVSEFGAAALRRRLPALRGVHSLDDVPVVRGSRAGDVWLAGDDRDLQSLEFMPQITGLKLDRSRVTTAGLASVKRGQNMRFLSLADTAISDEALVIISCWYNLEILILSRTEIGDEGLTSLAELTQLHTLFLGGTNITDQGLIHLAGLTHLRALSLSGTAITDDGLAHLGGLSELRYLALEDTAVAGTGLRRLAGLRKLECLLLGGSQVKDDALDDLPMHPDLLWIDLEKTAISDAGAFHLRKLPALQYVPARQSRMTPEGLRFFIERQPGSD